MNVNLNLTEIILAVLSFVGTYFIGRHRGGRSSRKVSEPKGTAH